jgi:hypothetical protein
MSNELHSLYDNIELSSKKIQNMNELVTALEELESEDDKIQEVVDNIALEQTKLDNFIVERDALE